MISTRRSNHFVVSYLGASMRSIPRGYRRHYIASWDDECNKLYDTFLTSACSEEAFATGSNLMDHHDEKRRLRWEDTVQGIDFTHSSRVA